MTIRIPAKVRRVLKIAAAPIKLLGSQATGIASFSAVVGSQPISRSSADEPPHAGLQ